MALSTDFLVDSSRLPTGPKGLWDLRDYLLLLNFFFLPAAWI